MLRTKYIKNIWPFFCAGTTIKKSEHKQQESIIYRVESTSLNKYRRKYHKDQSIIYDHVYDEQENEKTQPVYVWISINALFLFSEDGFYGFK